MNNNNLIVIFILLLILLYVTNFNTLENFLGKRCRKEFTRRRQDQEKKIRERQKPFFSRRFTGKRVTDGWKCVE